MKAAHKKQRLEFAKKYLKEPATFFNRVLWTDESKIELFSSRGPRYVWRSSGQAHEEAYTVPTVKHGGGSIMVWGCFPAAGTGDLHIIEGIMNAAKYQQILQDHMLPSARRLIGRRFIIQQDNDPKHTAKSMKEFLLQKKVKVMDWPSQSPDLNPIEMMWHHLKTAVAARHPKNINELKTMCQEEWSDISVAI